MNEELKVQDAGGADKAKLVGAVVLALAGIVAFYALGDAPAWQRWLAVIAGLALGAGVLAWSAYGRAIRQFVFESRVELRKIVWPTQRETLMTTVVVFAFVAIGGGFFWLVDLVLAWATRRLTGQG